MTQRQLDHAVARATGDSLATIARMGFSIVDPLAAADDDSPTVFGPNLVDWDRQEAEHLRYLPQRATMA
jgi:hypothetical protein